MNIKNELERLVKLYGEKVTQKLYDNDFEFESSGNCTATVKVDDEYFSIWMANSDENTNFYDSLDFGYDDILTKLFTKYSPIKEEYRTQIRNNINEKIKFLEMKDGLRRSIEKNQLSNDLFFRFKGVYREVRFTGYNDIDWWTKYKPIEVKEDDNITWSIDYDKMEAVYKPVKR